MAFVVGITTARPLASRMGRLGAELAQTADDSTRAALGARMAVAQKRMALVSYVLIALLLVSATGMAVARYQF